MIDIIVKRDNHKRHIVCPRCGSELAYNEEDVSFINELWLDYLSEVIICPNCNETIAV